jgi:hypothetical protein
MGTIKLRRLVRIPPLSESCTTGSGVTELAIGAAEVLAQGLGG